MNAMTIPAETLDKISALPSEKMSIIIQVVDQLAQDPVEKFREIRKRSASNPMSDEEVDAFVDSVRKKKDVTCR